MKNLFICCAGFEARSLTYARAYNGERFSNTILISYTPAESKRVQELESLCQAFTMEPVRRVKYKTFEPTEFEFLLKTLPDWNSFDRIVLDISAMSKFLIIILLVHINSFRGNVTLVYVEPLEYAPSKEDFATFGEEAALAANSPSTGVRDVVRTPSLSSLVMQRNPSCLIAFLSFNEQLIRALLYSVSPTKLVLIGVTPPIHSWRSAACQKIHSEIISEFLDDNPLGKDGLLLRRACTLDYRETLAIITAIFIEHEKAFRIILSPTGSKMQAVGCAFAKIQHPEIHIEYPTPESFLFDKYSSKEIRAVHEVHFENYSKEIRGVDQSPRIVSIPQIVSSRNEHAS